MLREGSEHHQEQLTKALIVRMLNNGYENWPPIYELTDVTYSLCVQFSVVYVWVYDEESEGGGCYD